MGNTNLPILCNIAQCDSDCMCVRVASYSTYFPCHHNITATVLILLVTSEQLTLSRAELLSGLSSKSLTPSLPLSTHTHTHNWDMNIYIQLPTHPCICHTCMPKVTYCIPSHILYYIEVIPGFIYSLLHRNTLSHATTRQEIWCELTDIQINPPLSCSEWWCQSVPPNRLWWDTVCACASVWESL